MLAIQGGLMGGGWPDVFRLGVGCGTANPLWRGLDMANYPRSGHAGGGGHCAGKKCNDGFLF